MIFVVFYKYVDAIFRQGKAFTTFVQLLQQQYRSYIHMFSIIEGKIHFSNKNKTKNKKNIKERQIKKK